jgi:hypothetical protein
MVKVLPLVTDFDEDKGCDLPEPFLSQWFVN